MLSWYSGVPEQRFNTTVITLPVQADSEVKFVAIVEVSEVETRNYIILYVVVGLVASLLLLVVIMLVFSLLRKKESEFQPIQFDYATDKMLTDTY